MAVAALAEIAGTVVEREVGKLFQVVGPGAKLFELVGVELRLVVA